MMERKELPKLKRRVIAPITAYEPQKQPQSQPDAICMESLTVRVRRRLMWCIRHGYRMTVVAIGTCSIGALGLLAWAMYPHMIVLFGAAVAIVATMAFLTEVMYNDDDKEQS